VPATNSTILLLTELNALAAGFFLLTAFGLIATRQVLACLKVFVIQSIFLAASAFVLGYQNASGSLFVVGGITLGVKAILIPWLFLRTLGYELRARREISQVFNIPTSLLISLALVVFAYFVAVPLLGEASGAPAEVNLPIGLAGLLLGAYAITVRREAVPQVIAILAMENGAFFAGISIAPDLPLIAELAAAFDVLIITRVMGVLTMKVHGQIGTTKVGEMVALKEE
jgi:hydrogenase-4 component E